MNRSGAAGSQRGGAGGGGTGGAVGGATGGAGTGGAGGGVINPTACSSGTAQSGDVTVSLSSLQQKISGCWRNLAGAEAFLALRSYLATARKHGRNPLAVLGQLFQGQAWLPPLGPPPAPPGPDPA